MKKFRFTESKIISIPNQHESGLKVGDICHFVGVWSFQVMKLTAMDQIRKAVSLQSTFASLQSSFTNLRSSFTNLQSTFTSQRSSFTSLQRTFVNLRYTFVS